jgi:hypothetical protein
MRRRAGWRHGDQEDRVDIRDGGRERTGVGEVGADGVRQVVWVAGHGAERHVAFGEQADDVTADGARGTGDKDHGTTVATAVAEL